MKLVNAQYDTVIELGIFVEHQVSNNISYNMARTSYISTR